MFNVFKLLWAIYVTQKKVFFEMFERFIDVW